MEYLGMPMIEWLKEEPTTAGIPVLVCSAAPDHVQEVEAFLQSKGVGIVYKPFELDGFLAAVTTALQSSGR
jgi:DNA-binding response OmpR family regulator